MPPGTVSDPKSAAKKSIGRLVCKETDNEYYFSYENANKYLGEGNDIVTFDVDDGMLMMKTSEGTIEGDVAINIQRFQDVAANSKKRNEWFNEWNKEEKKARNKLGPKERELMDKWDNTEG